MKVVISGATGFIGREVVIDLARHGHEVIALVRSEFSASDLPCKSIVWDATSKDSSTLISALRGVDAVINLAGEPIANSRWSAEVKVKLRDSRILGTQKLVEAISKLSPNERPKTLISGSAIGFYGNCGEETLTEKSAPGKDFLATLTHDWEQEAIRAEDFGLRVVRLRTSIVLGRNGGALEKMQPVVLGNGAQWMSWIHLVDIVRFIDFALTKSQISGAYNLSSPNPVRNREFTLKLAKAVGFPFVASMPKFILGVVLGEMSTMLLASSRALPTNAIKDGFTFLYATIDEAFKQIYSSTDHLEQNLMATQFVEKPIEEVFSYFSRAENLEQITPPWLNFHIVSKSTSEIAENTLINYRLKIHGVPASWQTKIERWIPNTEFVDTQIRGPYKKWHHTHRFEKMAGGTLVYDDVVYKVPGGIVGKVFLSALIRRDVTQIFNYRKKKIAEVFKSK